ncbi:MAG TPA: SDR family oxidoreductase [Thermoanaerobaculia bacterium]|nr:SDR family oxidoreductase [Thermoanaerobaculia bacterium]
MGNQTALITGASGGIGRDLAHLFAQDKIDVVLVARGEAKLRELATDLQQKHGITAHVLPADLARPEAPAEIARWIEARHIDIDVLVNNAGYGVRGAFVETDAKAELEMIQVNISALTHLTKLFLPPMVRRGRGRVLNVASTASFQPGPFMAVYYATKAYVLSFSEALSEETSGTGVSITALCPGPTLTNFAEAADMTKTRLFRSGNVMTSAKVAKIGYDAMRKGKRVVIAGAMNNLLAQSVRISPRALVTKVTRALQER